MEGKALGPAKVLPPVQGNVQRVVRGIGWGGGNTLMGEREEEGIEVYGQSGLHSKFKASLNYRLRPCLANKMEAKTKYPNQQTNENPPSHSN